MDRFLRTAFVGLVVASLLCVSCSKSRPADQSAALRTVRLVYVPYSSSLPALIGQERGLFQREGVTVELVRMETSNEAILALSKGDVDGIMGIGLTSLLAIEAKTPGVFQLVWHAVETKDHFVNAILVPNNSTFKTIEDLRGKTVGTFTGATQLLNLQAIFKTALGSADAVTLTQVSPNLQLQALEKGDLAALFTIEPNVAVALDRGIARILVDNPRCNYILDPFPAGGGVLASKLIRERPDDARKVVRALDEAIRLIRTDEAACKAVLPKFMPIEASVATRSRLYGWWTSKEVDLRALQRVIDLFVADKVVDTSVDARSISVSLE